MIFSKSTVSSAALLVALSASSVFGETSANRNSHDPYPGAVFVMTNSVEGNQILRFGRQANGTLISLGSTPTDGRGSGGNVDPLGSQNSLMLSQDGGFLLAVNSASGTISSFQVDGANLQLVDKKSTGGSAPNAIAQRDNLVYVLNQAGNSSVVGFRFEDGQLSRIPSAISYLSTAISGGSSLTFTQDGKFLLATEKTTGQIDAFPINADGTMGSAVVTKYAGIFDLAVTASGAVVAVGSPTMTSSIVNPDGTLTELSSPTIPGGGTCWVVVTPNGAFAYASNPGGSLIDGYSIAGSGVLSPIGTGNVGTTIAGAKPLDLAVTYDGKFLYSNNAANGSVGIWTINADGTLTAQTPVSLPVADANAGFNGIAAY
jgi:6-phosphogluconolactonase